jgi:hypothetical protein
MVQNMMGVARKFHSVTDNRLRQLQKLLVLFSKLAKLIHNGMLLAISVKSVPVGSNGQKQATSDNF